ncbi:MAG: hypothetical protein P9M00_05610 [Candidatus Tritonobacter lacicola]|nr:hypothetical protein [Candidatus Tritonobacter lacicola]
MKKDVHILLFVFSVFLLIIVPRHAAGQPNYAFLALEYSHEIMRMSLDDPPAYTIDAAAFADASDGVCRPLAMAFHPEPIDPSYPNTDHLYVAGWGEGVNVIKIMIDRDTGDRVGVEVFGPAPPGGIRSLAFQPGTNRLYAAIQYRVYKFSEDGSSYETVIYENAFYDECQIAFHPDPVTGGNLYVATGFNDEIMVFSPTGNHLQNLESYDNEWPPIDWYLPQNLLFVRDGSAWWLLSAAIRDYYSNCSFSFLCFNPIDDIFLGDECVDQLGVFFNVDKCGATGALNGDYFTGVLAYPRVRRTAHDFSSVTIIKDYPHPQLPGHGTYAHLTVKLWPPIDADGDGLSDVAEVGRGTNPDNADSDGGGEGDWSEVYAGRNPRNIYDDDGDGDGLSYAFEIDLGTGPNDPDSDDDGYTDYEEIAYNGDDTEYTPYPTPSPDTNPLRADTDGDDFSDLVEIAGGSDPLAGGSTPSNIRISFQPSGSTRPDNYAVDTGWSYEGGDWGREYGWQ